MQSRVRISSSSEHPQPTHRQRLHGAARGDRQL
jgi:hypothetical protein